MAGLYKKALDYLQSHPHLRLVTPDEVEQEEEQISAEDQEEINAQIEQMLEQSKLRIDNDTFRVEAERKGGVLPVIVNIVALLLVGGVLFASLYYFDRKEQEVSSGRQSIVSAESRLLDTMAEESERRLNAKNEEISSIQRELATMISQRQEIQSSAEEAIRLREEQLRSELDQRLADERARLQEGGVSEEDLASQLEAFESELQSGFDQQLQSVRDEANREMQERENTLNALISEYEQSLEDAESERTELVQDLEARRSELEEQLAASESALEGERARFSEELQRMRDQQDEEQFVLDQLLASYSGIQNDIDAGSLESARSRIADLRSYIDDIELSRLPVMQARRSVELFLVDSLDTLVQNELREQEIDTASLIESANILASAAALVEEGDVLYAAGNFEAARARYMTAFERIPALSGGFDSFREIEETRTSAVSAEKTAAVQSLVAQGDASFLSGDYQSAVTYYSRAALQATDSEILGSQFADRITEAGYEVRRAADTQLLASVRTDLESALERESTLQSALNEQAQEQLAALTSLNEQLEDLQSQKTTLESERDGLLEHLSTMGASRDNLADRLAAVEESRDGLNEQLSEKQEEVASLLNQIDAANAEHEVEIEAALGVVKADLALAEAEIDRLEKFESKELQREEIASYVAEYADYFTATITAPTESTDESEVLDLLETKFAIVTVMNSDAVKDDYPDLAQKLNEYLTALIEDNTADTIVTTLLELNLLIDHIAREREIDPFMIPEYETGEQQRLLALFLNKLALLLQ